MNKSVVYQPIRDKISRIKYQLDEIHVRLVGSFTGDEYEEADGELQDEILLLREHAANVQILLDIAAKRNKQIEWKRNKLCDKIEKEYYEKVYSNTPLPF